MLTVEGGTGAIIEYHGPGADSISATGKGTICNMGAEIGATTSLFPYDANMEQYLKATGREAIADAADKVAEELRPDDGAHYDQLIEIDLDQLKPLINGPHSPDRAHRVGAGVGAAARENDWPLEISSALIGSCTNSSYEDITRAASIARQASAKGLRVAGRAADHPWVGADPGDHRARRSARRPRGGGRDGAGQRLRTMHRAVVAAGEPDRSAQHDRQLVQPQLPKAQRRVGQDARLRDVADTVMALALAGRLDFDPTTDTLTAPDGTEVRLDPPVGEVLPDRGYDTGQETFTAPPDNASAVDVEVHPESERLQVLEPFPAWDGEDYFGLPVLMKAHGKCTTDHISAAGPWLRYRGHLENISGNLFLGVVNAHTGATGEGKDAIDGQTRPFPEIAKNYALKGIRWCAVGDRNYGEGSSRDTPRCSPGSATVS